MEEKHVILIVDDEWHNLELLEAHLSPAGYEVITAGNGQEALEHLGKRRVDLIISDVIMPVMNGYELTGRLRQSEATRLLPLILVTSLKSTEDRIKGIKAGCDDFIGKPFNKAEVLSRVQMLLKMGFYRRQLDEKEKFDYILSKINDSIIVFDREMRISRLNRAAELFFGIAGNGEPADFLGHIRKHFRVIYDGDLDGDIKNKAVFFDLEREATDKSPRLILEVNSSVIRNAAENEPANILLLARDVTAARDEEILKRDFLSLISHKLRTPLVVMTFSLGMLGDGTFGEMKKEQSDIVDSLLNNVKSLNSLVNRLMEFVETSRVASGKKEKIDLSSDLPRLLEAIVSSTPGKKVETALDIDKDSAVSMNQDCFSIVITELVQNAVKFNGGDKPKVAIKAKKVGNSVHIAVADNGPGISPEYMDKLFQKFLQIEKYFTGNVEGVGLGLALVKKLVESHGGEIKASSVLGKGSEFTAILPSA